jgi:hypothetical protein
MASSRGILLSLCRVERSRRTFSLGCSLRTSSSDVFVTHSHAEQLYGDTASAETPRIQLGRFANCASSQDGRGPAFGRRRTISVAGT